MKPLKRNQKQNQHAGRDRHSSGPGLTRICCISDVLPVAGADEELDLGEERLKVGDVWHGELHESGTPKKKTR